MGWSIAAKGTSADGSFSLKGFTIALSFPKGVVAEPMRAERVRWLLADNRGLLAALAGLALLVTYVARRWRQVGRDPQAGVIIAREAGATVTAMDGSPYRLDSLEVCCTNGALHETVVDLITRIFA